MAISWNYFKQYIPGVLICAVIALAATFLPEHYGGPQLPGFLIGFIVLVMETAVIAAFVRVAILLKLDRH